MEENMMKMVTRCVVNCKRKEKITQDLRDDKKTQIR